MRKTLLLLAVSPMLYYSCKKEDTPQHSQGWQDNTVAGLEAYYTPYAPPKVTYSINAGMGGIITTSGGIQFTIDENSFTDKDGKTVKAGHIFFTCQEHFTNCDLLRDNLSTVSTKQSLLITGGAFYVSVAGENNATARLVKPIKVSVPEHNGNFNADFRVYEGLNSMGIAPNSIGNPNRIGWKETGINWSPGFMGSNRSYDFSIDRLFSWYGMKRTANKGSGETTINVKLPAGFGNVNTEVFVFVPDRGMIHLAGDASSELFTSKHYTVPMGTPLSIFPISATNDILTYSLFNVIVNSDAAIEVEKMTPVTKKRLIEIIEKDLH